MVDTAPRYTVHTRRVPVAYTTTYLRAWISDAELNRPLSWHHEIEDAARVCDALNAVEQRDRAERALAVHANVMEF